MEITHDRYESAFLKLMGAIARKNQNAMLESKDSSIHLNTIDLDLV